MPRLHATSPHLLHRIRLFRLQPQAHLRIHTRRLERRCGYHEERREEIPSPSEDRFAKCDLERGPSHQDGCVGGQPRDAECTLLFREEEGFCGVRGVREAEVAVTEERGKGDVLGIDGRRQGIKTLTPQPGL